MTNNNRKAIAEILKRAIKGEEDGHRFYAHLAAKAANVEARRRLEGLRDDEIRHKETLCHMYQELVGGEIGPLPERGINVLAEVFSRGRLEECRTEMEYVNLAIEAELAAAQFYQNERSRVDDPQYHALFDQLADEEHRHYELLQAEKDALGGNYHWFSLDEGSPMEH